MSNHFAVRTTREEGISVIALEGYVDAHTAPQFESAVQAEVDAGNYRIVVDCEKLGYISSAGLGVFMSFIEEVRERGGDIRISGLAPRVRHTFDILGFNEIFDMVETEAMAIQRFTAG